MSSHADTIRRERESRHWTNAQRREAWGEHWPRESAKREGDADRAVDALLAENQRLQDELTATEKLALYEHERYQRLRDALQRLKSNVWAWEVPDDVRQQVDEALAGDAE